MLTDELTDEVSLIDGLEEEDADLLTDGLADEDLLIDGVFE